MFMSLLTVYAQRKTVQEGKKKCAISLVQAGVVIRREIDRERERERETERQRERDREREINRERETKRDGHEI
jgi:hypothetical protein